MVWVIERNTNGEAIDISGYAFVDENEQCVVVSAFPYSEDDLTGIYEFPHKDVFDNLEEAQAAIDSEIHAKEGEVNG